jgi:hypothetical protein
MSPKISSGSVTATPLGSWSRPPCSALGAPTLAPEKPCTPGSSPDCDDPLGDGSYVDRLGGAASLTDPFIGGPVCSDLDGDGRAGHPDSR